MVASCILKFQRLTPPWNPLALGLPRHIDDLAGLEPLYGQLGSDRGRLIGCLQAKFHKPEPACTLALAKCPASGLFTREVLAVARRDLDSAITVAIELFDLSDAVWRYLHYGHWNGYAVFGKTRVIPDLRPTKPIAILLTFSVRAIPFMAAPRTKLGGALHTHGTRRGQVLLRFSA